MALFGSAAAAADASTDAVGKTYSDASKAISDAGGTPVVSSRFGDKLATDDCWVVRAQKSLNNKVLLSLDCYQPAAGGQPGIAAGNSGLEAKAIKDAVAQQQAGSEAGVTSSSQR